MRYFVLGTGSAEDDWIVLGEGKTQQEAMKEARKSTHIPFCDAFIITQTTGVLSLNFSINDKTKGDI